MTAPKNDIHPIRYLVPNAITGASLLFGMVSITNAAAGNFSLSAWMIIWAVLCDRLDGLAARALRATSALGMQLDSFADFLNFGVAPSALVYQYLEHRHDLPFHAGGWQWWLLCFACAVWVLAAVFRLARYNITADDALPTKIFFGVPTTLAGGLLGVWFLALLKYDASYPTFGGAKIFGNLVTPASVWTYLPVGMMVFAYLMVSSLPMPKGGKSDSKIFTVCVMSLMALGYVCGFGRIYPEIIVWPPTAWALIFLIWGQVSADGRGIKPPPWFS
jgi:CDP-diacylglycerol---serine O-phosphatidyltransferase